MSEFQEDIPTIAYSDVLGETIGDIMGVIKKVFDEHESCCLDSQEDKLTLQRAIEKEIWRLFRV